MDYRTWNDAIAARFFKPEMSGRSIYLYVTRELIEGIGAERGFGVSDFISATKKGFGFAQGSPSTFEGAYEWCKRWRSLRGIMQLEFPPYICHLALAVLAAGYGDEEEFSTAAYYPRLRTLLGEGNATGTYPGFDLLDFVWEDLEKWSSEDKKGFWGVFEVRRAGKRVHVDVPFAQTLLTETEREALHRVFASVGFHPALPPSERELAAAILAKARNDLRPWTLRLLEGQVKEPGFRETLLQAISEELEEWDGSVPPPKQISSSVASMERWKSGSVAICLYPSALGPVEFRFRCTIGGEVPAEGWELSLPNGETAVCEEDVSGWSETLRWSHGAVVNAALFNWENPIEFRDEGRGVVFKMPGGKLRLFISGEALMLPGFIETRQLPLGVPFFAAVRRESAADLQAWGQASCTGFSEAKCDTLPPGWKLFRAESAHNVNGMEAAFTQLSLPSAVQVTLMGGIVMTPPFEYFDFGPPSIRVRSSHPVSLQCNGRVVEEAIQDAVIDIPSDFYSEGTARVDILRSGEIVRTVRFFVRSQFDAAQVEVDQWFDSFGEPTKDDSASFAFVGACVRADVEGVRPFNTIAELPSYGTRRVFLVGREIGQIVCWPREPIPSDWQAVWAIPFDRRGRVEYCGPGLPVPSPILSTRLSKRQRKEWKEKVYGWRKLVGRPKKSVLNHAWIEYVNAASSAT